MSKNIIILTGLHPYIASGKVVIDLKNLFKDQGHRVAIISNTYVQEKLEGVINFDSRFTDIRGRIIKKLRHYLNIKSNTDKDFYMFGYKSHLQKRKYQKLLKRLPFKPDLFIYMFPHGFLNEKDLYHLNLNTKAPILRYMVDMVEMTGGCHYAWNCKGYQQECGSCPGLFSKDPKDYTYENLNFKNHYTEKTSIIPIAASEWQFQQIKRSSVFRNKEVFKIPLFIDDKIFRPMNSDSCRKKLKLPLKKHIIFFGSVNTSEKRKGATEIILALEHLNKSLTNSERKGIHIAIAGKIDNEIRNKFNFETTILGYLNYGDLAMAYNAADVFICPSVEDSGPSMINQAALCGTPTVAFEMGVALDLVNETLRCNLYDNKGLAKCINSVLTLEPQDYKLLSENVKKRANEFGNAKVIYEKWFKLVNSL